MELTLYHIAKNNIGNTVTLHPSIPTDVMVCEDNITPRICASPSILGCVRALGLTEGYTNKELDEMIFHLYHTTVDTDEVEVYQPSAEEVPDCWITSEFWIMEPVRFHKWCEFTFRKQMEINQAYSRYEFKELDPERQSVLPDRVYAPETYFNNPTHFSTICRVNSIDYFKD